MMAVQFTATPASKHRSQALSLCQAPLAAMLHSSCGLWTTQAVHVLFPQHMHKMARMVSPWV